MGVGVHPEPQPRSSACAWQHVPSFRGSDILTLLVSAEDVCEQSSFIGYLDQRADPFYIWRHAGRHAQAERHAAHDRGCGVHREQHASGGACPRYAATTPLPRRRPASSSSPRSRPSRLGERRDRAAEQIHSIDVALNYALANITHVLNKVQAGPGQHQGQARSTHEDQQRAHGQHELPDVHWHRGVRRPLRAAPKASSGHGRRSTRPTALRSTSWTR